MSTHASDQRVVQCFRFAHSLERPRREDVGVSSQHRYWDAHHDRHTYAAVRLHSALKIELVDTRAQIDIPKLRVTTILDCPCAAGPRLYAAGKNRSDNGRRREMRKGQVGEPGELLERIRYPDPPLMPWSSELCRAKAFEEHWLYNVWADQARGIVADPEYSNMMTAAVRLPPKCRLGLTQSVISMFAIEKKFNDYLHITNNVDEAINFVISDRPVSA